MNNFQLLLSLIYGVIPYKHLNAKANIVFSYMHMYIAPLIYLICFGFVSYGSFAVNKHSKCGTVCGLSNMLFTILGLCLYLSTHVITLWRGKKFHIDFKKFLDDIDVNLRKCEKVATNFEKKKESKYRQYITLLLVAACFVNAMVYDIKELISFYPEYFVVIFMVSNFPYSSSSIAMFQFIFYVAEICKRFCWLNELFEKIDRESDCKHAPVMIFDIETEIKRDFPSNQELRQRHIVDYVAAIEPNYERDELNDLEVVPADSSTSETNLPELFKLHHKLLSLSVLTNKEFGLQCIPYMTACFVITIFCIFLQAKVFLEVGGKNPLLDYVLLLYFFWSLTTMLVAHLILRMCYNANSYSKQSAVIVHEIMQKKPLFMLSNDVYYNKMKSFTLQYLHWERYFQFNGFGLFVLDYTFIFSAIGCGTSYLIVLLQFNLTSVLNEDGLL